MKLVRSVIPYLLLPLAIIACALASSPWLRAFPSAVLATPLFGAALLSVLVPVIVVGIGVRQIWLTLTISCVIFVFYELLVTLREPLGFDDLYSGLVHGPSQLLTYALPLISPRTLLVAPVALCWLSGALLGECVARAWQSVLPYAALLGAFALAYAGSARAITSSEDGHRYDTILAAALLLTLLLLRTVQAWVAQDNAAETTQPDGVLPLRSLTIGAALSVIIALGAVGVAQTTALATNPNTPQRHPPVDRTKPFTPISFIAGLRPSNPRSPGTPVFKIVTQNVTPRYIPIASLDYYDGDGWSFNREFRPSGGIVPNDADTTLRANGPTITQQYTIEDGPIAGSPWMPYVYRPQIVTGVSVNVDADSGMIVPSEPLQVGSMYTVRSTTTATSFTDLPDTAAPGGYGPAGVQLPQSVVATNALADLVTTLGTEVQVKKEESVIGFLQAVAKSFRDLALAGSTSAPSASPSTTPGTSVHRFIAPLAAPTTASRTPSPTPAASPSAPAAGPSAAPQRAGGTSFAEVLTSIRQYRSATPEQFATLMCLIARQIGVPAQVMTGFRLAQDGRGSDADPYAVTMGGVSRSVTTAEAYTWVEIPISGVGWTVLDPSPTRLSAATPKSSARPVQSTRASSSPAQDGQLTQAPNSGHAPAKVSRLPPSENLSITSIMLIVLAVIVALALLLVLVQFGRRRLRARRRRRYGDPRQRLLGAWQESLDMLQEYGMPDLANLTSTEVSAETGVRFGGEPAAHARALGDAANTAIFSPTSWIGPAEADAAWRTQGVLTRTVRDRLSWPARIGSRLRYRSTGGARRRVSRAFYAGKARRAQHSTTGRRRS